MQNMKLLCTLTDVRIVSVDVCKKKESNPPVSNGSTVWTKEGFEGCIRSSHELQYEASSMCQISRPLVLCESYVIPSMIDSIIQHSSKKMSLISGKFVEWDDEDCIPSYDICPLVKKPYLLPDCWSEIMSNGIGTVFKGGAVDFRTEMIKYSIRLGFKFRYKKNNARCVSVIYGEEENSKCTWFIKTRRQPVTMFFEIHKANFVHSCVGKLKTMDASRISSRILGNLVLNNIKNKPEAFGKDIVKEMQLVYGLEVPYWKAHRAAEAARDQIYGSYVESYDQLRWYCEALVRTNPGSTVSLEFNQSSHKFERLFVGFKTCIEGFIHCRPMLFIDGTFMKGRAKGTLLAATAKDGDNGLFPVAFAIVFAENEDNWKWFLCMLRDHVKHDKQVFYLSDGNKGLVKAFPTVFEEPVHFYCMYHLLSNLKGKFGGGWGKMHRKKIGKAFKDAVYAPNERIFKEKIQNFMDIGGNKATKWLEKVPKDKWAVAYSPHITRYGEMTFNAAESFNAWIQEARSLPITHMIETIHFKISRWYFERRQESDKWTSLLVPTKDGEWHYLQDNGRTWYVASCPADDYQVLSTLSVRVNLETHTCTCHRWQITGFPCVHAITVIGRHGGAVSDHIDECFATSKYKQCYQSDVNPIPETERFEYRGSFGHCKILHPNLNRPAGRPKKERYLSFGETPKRH